jgi:rhodanese-related sulfurtransferase
MVTTGHETMQLRLAKRSLNGKVRQMDELEITPADVKARLDGGEKLVLIDVREPWEQQLCRIEGAKLVPLGSLAASLQTLPDVDEVICYCHHGMRSLDAAAWLRFQGIEKAKSLAGGIERWSVEVDPKVPRY